MDGKSLVSSLIVNLVWCPYIKHFAVITFQPLKGEVFPYVRGFVSDTPS